MSQELSKFYISVTKKDDKIIAYTSSTDIPSPSPIATDGESASFDTVKEFNNIIDFSRLMRETITAFDAYRKFITTLVAAAPLLPGKIAHDMVERFLSENGVLRQDLSRDDVHVYECSLGCYRQFAQRSERINAATQGAELLPEIVIIGLISAYDAFLTKLLRLVFNTKKELIFGSSRQIPFSDLTKYDSIEDIRNSIIDKEIEAIIRESYHEQFEKMESKFGFPLKKGLLVWPKFIELCERRNLLTHTGGIISKQYVENCETHNVQNIGEIGQKLDVRIGYVVSSVNIVYEISIKLLYVLWRKFKTDEISKADDCLHDLGYELVVDESYDLAEKILEFGKQTIAQFGGSDRTRRMMIINLANTYRLRKRPADAVRIVDSEDWSASSDDFSLCVAAIREDVSEIVRLMHKLGNTDAMLDAYRSWPIFRGLRRTPEMAAAFEAIFGESLIKPKSMETKVNDLAETPDLGQSESAPSDTVH